MTKIKLLTLRETPAYRVSTNPAVCTTPELLAAVIGGSRQIEAAENLLASFDGDLRRIYNAQPDEIANVPGVGPQTAVRIKAALALGMMLNRPMEDAPLSVNSPGDAYALLREMEMFEQEHLRIILLNTKSHVVGIPEIYIGTINSAQLRMAEVFRPAIQRNATAIILAHNHPSGDPTPSPDDASTTRTAVQAGKLFDIEVHDHIIIGHGRYVSMRERGLGF
ncbi:MAG: DNA repair protein RadC [Chloroflexota bacterium]|jgi:DNA repair protein RadC